MKTHYLIYIAFKNLWFYRVRSILSILAMAIGVGAIVFLVSLGFGLQKITISQIGSEEFLKILDVSTDKTRVAKLDDLSLEKIRNLSGVKSIVPIISLAGKLDQENQQSGVIIYGTEVKFFDLPKAQFLAGDNFSGSTEEAIVTSATLKDLQLKNPQDVLGKNIKLDIILTKQIAPKIQEEQEIKENLEFKVKGVIKDDETKTIFLPFTKLVNLGVKNFQFLKIEVANQNSINVVRQQIENMGFGTDWAGETIAQANQIFNIFKIILGSFGAIALLVAIMGIINVLTISLMERTREIGIMKIRGMQDKNAQKLFWLEAEIMSFAAGLLGLGLNFLLTFILNGLFYHTAIRAQVEPVQVFYTPLWFAVLVIGFSLFLGFIIGLYPAWRSKKINPLDALRYE